MSDRSGQGAVAVGLRRGWAIATAALLTIAGAVAAKQPGEGAPAANPASEQAVREDVAQAATARRIARAALLNLRAIPQPTQGDYRIAGIVLDMARALLPDDAPLLRRTIEAWQAAGESDVALELTRELLRRHPDDQSALLRVVSASVSRLQSVVDRLSASDRLSQAAALPPTIRSRLALDAALLARERGDEQGFVDRLTRAAQIDAANKEAAALAATYFLERSQEPLGRVELLANLLLADPLDPSTHLRLGQELLAHGAYEGADRFLRLVDSLIASLRLSPTSEERERLWIAQRMATWGWKGPDAVLDEINEEEQKTRDAIARARYQAELRGEKPDDAAAEFSPDPAIELTRLVIADAIERRDQMELAMQRLDALSSQTLERIQSLLDDKESPPSPQRAENLRRTALINRAQMTWFRLWSGLELDRAAADLDRLASESSAVKSDDAAPGGAAHEAIGAQDAFSFSQRALSRDRGWLAGQRGDRDEAERLLAPLTDADPLARLGLARAADIAGDRRAAILGYARLALEQPATLVGLYARTRVERLIERRLAPTPTAASLDSYARSLPAIIDEMTSDPAIFTSLTLRLPTPKLSPLDPLLVRVRLGNTSPIPLAVGDVEPIGSTLLLTPRISARTERAFTDAQPEVARLSERLRLEPRESFEETVWVGGGQAAQLLDLLTAQPVSVRWSALQSFMIGPGGNLREGGLALRGQTGLATRPSAAGANESVEQILARLDAAQGPALLEAILLATSLVVEEQAGAEARLSADDRASLASAIAERLPGWPVEARAVLAVVMPAARVVKEAAPIDEALRKDSADMVRAVVLLSRVDGPDDPLLDETIADGGGRLPELATLVRLRLRGWSDADAAKQDEQGSPDASSPPTGSGR